MDGLKNREIFQEKCKITLLRDLYLKFYSTFRRDPSIQVEVQKLIEKFNREYDEFKERLTDKQKEPALEEEKRVAMEIIGKHYLAKILDKTLDEKMIINPGKRIDKLSNFREVRDQQKPGLGWFYTLPSQMKPSYRENVLGRIAEIEEEQ